LVVFPKTFWSPSHQADENRSAFAVQCQSDVAWSVSSRLEQKIEGSNPRQVIKCYAVVCNLTCIVIFSLRELNDKSMMKNVCMYKCVKNSVFLSKQFPKQRKTIVKSRSSWQNHRNLIKYEFASQNRFGETIDIYGSNIKVIPSCRLLVMMKY
jgi:hypothetical protein